MEQHNSGAATAPATAQRTGLLSTLCILSFIGSGLAALFSLIGIFASGWVMSLLGGGMSKVDTSNMTPDQAAAVGAAGGMAGMLGSYLMIIMIVGFVLSGLSFFGVVKMWQMKKSGFWIYSVINGILAILALIGGSWFYGIVGVLFIVGYGMNLKHMK